MITPAKCRWCGKIRRRFSRWEQMHLKTETYSPLCVRCARERFNMLFRLNMRFSALLPMRKMTKQEGQAK